VFVVAVSDICLAQNTPPTADHKDTSRFGADCNELKSQRNHNRHKRHFRNHHLVSKTDEPEFKLDIIGMTPQKEVSLKKAKNGDGAKYSVDEEILHNPEHQPLRQNKSSVDEMSVCNERSGTKQNSVRPTFSKQSMKCRSKSIVAEKLTFVNKFQRNYQQTRLKTMSQDYQRLRTQRFSISQKQQISKKALEYHNKSCLAMTKPSIQSESDRDQL